MSDPKLTAEYRKVETNRRWRERNKDKQKEYAKRYKETKGQDVIRGELLTKYWPGLDPQEALEMYQELYAKQHGKCAICKKHQDRLNKTLCVDHCHDTLLVRGLLCFNCNIGIGKLGDTYQDLVQAAKYLWAFEQQIKEG